MPDRPTLQRITRYVIGASVLLAAAAFAFGGAAMGLGALVGGTLAVLNWLAMGFVGERILVASERGRLVWGTLLALKMGALLALTWAVLSTGLVDPIGFSVGVSGLVLGVLLGAFHLAASNPAALNPAALNPAALNPAVSNPAVSNPAASNPAASPSEEG